MFPLRQALRLGTRLTYARELTLRQISLIPKENLVVNVHKRTFVHEKTDVLEPQQDSQETGKQYLGKVAGRLRLMFTCKRCQTRNNKTMSKTAYEEGVVIIRCDGCKNNHLIADNLGWFTDITRSTNIEKIMAEKGESVRKILNDRDGYMEAVPVEYLEPQQESDEPTKLKEETEMRVQYEKVGTPEKL